MRGARWCFALAFLAGARVRGAEMRPESKYAGDRDVRYVNCAVPCEFVCAHPSSAAADLLAHDAAGRVLRTTGTGQHRFDLLPNGRRHYSEQLGAALEVARVALTDSPEGLAVEVAGRAAVGLSPVLQAMHWDCAENCRYECMIQNSELRRSLGEQQVQYFGKWSFTRVLGTQELLSWTGSLLNGLPFLCFFLREAWRAPCAGARPATVWLFRVQCVLNVNTWVQSALFHARDTPLTEKLDYFCANMYVANGLACALYLHCPEDWSALRAALTAYALPVGAWSAVVLYLVYVKFDYGLFMTLTVTLGAIGSIAWLAWFLRLPRSAPKRRFAWKVLLATWGVYLVLPLELLDFPPYFGFLDAHALWHWLTVPLQYCYVAFVRDLLRLEAEERASKHDGKHE